ncbi:host attachment protein [Janthinobacterium rivuli]|uniref:Host attachment protein n=1 Tax=Janthinobacterium rivuli TaxID=2751478 RepID=A0ABY8I7X7_9BURK|nr:host attachment protein [Janthinobacterium rivuli]WFR81026.1 host attachment protein [Janthinobacterium rivuli]
MDVTWVLVADSSRARLFALGQQNQLGELQDFVNPAGRDNDNALNSDAACDPAPSASGHNLWQDLRSFFQNRNLP